MQSRALLLSVWLCLGMASLVFGQSVFEVTPSGTFLSTVTMPDGSEWSSSGLSLASGGQFTPPDRASWNSAGLTFPSGSTVQLPDLSFWSSTGLTHSASSALRFPDNSFWNAGGLSMGAGKPLYIDSGTNTSPGLGFTQQVTLGLYRFGLDDMRVTVSGGAQAARFYLNGTSPQLQAPVGESTQFAPVSGRLCTSVTAAPTTGLVLQALGSCAIPAGGLSIDAQSYLKVRASATTAANGNSKTFAIAFGSTTCATHTGTLNNGVIVLEATIIRATSTTQKCMGVALPSSGSQTVTHATPAETLANNLTLAFNGTTPTASGDLTLQAYTVEVWN